MIDKLRLRVRFEGEIPNSSIVDFVSGNFSHILSTSLFESTQVSVLEGILMGLVPLVHNWPGAETLYPKEILWSSIDDLKSTLRRAEPIVPNREWVEKHFGRAKQIEQVKKLLREIDNHKV